MNTRYFKHTFLCFSFLSLCFLSEAQTVKYSNEFMAIGVGARAHGMGNSMVANVKDGTAGYWNPAGLCMQESAFEINAMHAEWFAGVSSFEYGSMSKRLNNVNRNAAIGLSFLYLGTQDIPYTFNLIGADGSVNYDNVSSFSARDIAVLLTYSTDLHKKVPGLRIGGSVKVINRGVQRFATAWGFGLDLGLQYVVNDKFTLGLMARDITTTFNAWKFTYTDEEIAILQSTGNEIIESSVERTLPRFVLGGAYKTRFGKAGILGELDLDFTTDGQRNVLISSSALNIDPRIGFEFDYNQFVFLRAGLHNFQRIKNTDGGKDLSMQPNVGIGVKVASFNIDYAFTNINGLEESLYSHVISLKISLKQKTKSNYTGPPPSDSKPKTKPKKKGDTDFPDFIEQID